MGDGQTVAEIRRPTAQAAAKPARLSRYLWDRNPDAPKTLHVLGLRFNNVSLAEAADQLISAAVAQRRTRAVFVNAHVVNCANADKAYLETVESADRIYADGSGLAIAARLAGRRLRDNVNGTDLLPVLAAAALRAGTSLYLVGGVAGAAARSAETLAALGSGGAIAGTHHGYVTNDAEAEARAIEAINASGASIVLVGMGVPLQDQWIRRNAHRLTAPVVVGVGGLFDFYSGRVSRAPRLLRSIGLEWTWRLAQEPGRMWRRYLIGNARFLAHAVLKARQDANAGMLGARQEPAAR